MGGFANGLIPESLLVKDRHGNLWLPGTYRKWVIFQQYIYDKTGVWLYITPPAHGAQNAYRDLAGQKSLRQKLGFMASVAGRSSHGGIWTGQTTGRYGLPTWVENVPSGAFDVGNIDAVPWSVVEEAAQHAGLLADIVVPRERWHFVDLEPWAIAAPATASPEEEDMPLSDDDIRRIASVVWNHPIGEEATPGRNNLPAWKRLSWAHADGAYNRRALDRLVARIGGSIKDGYATVTELLVKLTGTEKK